MVCSSGVVCSLVSSSVYWYVVSILVVASVVNIIFGSSSGVVSRVCFVVNPLASVAAGIVG